MNQPSIDTTVALEALEAALDKKALDPVIFDVSHESSYTDHIMIVSGTSDRHVGAIADAIADHLGASGKRLLGIERSKDGKWTLIDFGELVVHVFYHPVRELYDLEGMWSEAPRLEIDVPQESRYVAVDSYVYQ